MIEIFKDIEGYEGLYQVSNTGNIKTLPKKIKNRSGWSVRPEKILKGEISNSGYLRVILYNNYNTKRFSVHRLVALHFVDNPDTKPQVNHKDGNKKNNAAYNLEWATALENMRHSFSTGLNDLSKIDHITNHYRKLTLEQAKEIKNEYKKGGISQRKLAARYGVHHSIIHTITSGRLYKTAI